MPNTPIWTIPYPALTDAPNGPSNMQALAARVDTVLQLRVVSTTGDVAAPFTGQIVFATTDLRMYRYTGSAWVTLNNTPPACVLLNDTAFATTSGADTYVPMTVIQEQTTIGGNAMGAIATPGTITIREDGLYAYGARGQWSTGTAAGERRMAVTLNTTSPPTRGSAAAYTSMVGNTSPQGCGQEATGVRRFVAGDVLRMYCAQSSGGTLWLEGGASGANGGGYTRFWAYKIKD